MRKIFVNYRRQGEGGWPAEAITAVLEREFGVEHVFLDVKNVRPSADFAARIRFEVASAAALVVVMGKNWHKVQDPESGEKRIKEDDDWVREEIRTALQHDIPIFILLLDGAELPKPEYIPEDIRAFLGREATTVREGKVDLDLAPVIEELAALTGIPRGRAAGSKLPPVPTVNLAPSRAPIVIAIQEDSSKIGEEDLLAAERHLTLTLRDDHVRTLRSIHDRLGDAASAEDIIDLGIETWRVLTGASHRLDGLFRQIAAAEQSEGYPQPVAWTGRLDLLTTVYKAILAACTDDGEGPSFVTVAHGAHYFHVLAQSTRSMRRRQGDTRARVNVASLDSPPGGDSGVRALAAALEYEVVLLSGDNLDVAMQELVRLIPRQPDSPTRVVVAFGAFTLDGSSIDSALAVFPCISFGGPALRDRGVVRETERGLAIALKTQAVSVAVSRLRAGLVTTQFARGQDADLAMIRDSLAWSTWSWVGRPLFSDEFGEVRKPACPHLMDLRSVSTLDWYYERFADIPAAYRLDALTARQPSRLFHLYLSGAGGTGKSCFLHAIYETLEINNPNVLPVWYKVHAPSSEWDAVEAQIKKEVRAAIGRHLGASAAGLLSPADERKELDNFLLDLLEQLRARKEGVNQIVLFIDQLERTFESGEYPELRRLNTISTKMVTFLKKVGVENGVRVFLASRKQYLADFLSSFETAEDIRLHFNVLQTLSVDKEGAAFVDRIAGWSNANNLTAVKVHIEEAAAHLLAARERGHPLNMVLALIQLLSRSDVPGEITASMIEDLRPWERRFYVDEALMGKDELDWYFFLAMAHAQTEIVRREEVLWRLGLVSRDLARRTKELGQSGVLERLWLLGHLGRTMHPRPQGEDSSRFLEFFHANLRDHLVTNVMNRVEEDPAIQPHPVGPRPRGMPRAWRALDRLREIARDWEHVQQPLVQDDIRVLMDHKEVFTDRIPVPQGGRPVEVESFYLLFLRDVEDRREAHFQAARECVAYSALVHDVDGRWAFRTLFPNIAAGPERGSAIDDSQVGCCRRWLRPTRADSQSRLRILHYLVELRDAHANRLLSDLVFDSARDDETWQQLADILAEPLVSATHRSAFLTSAVQFLQDENVVFPGDNWHTERFGAFLAAACGGDRHEVCHLLETLPDEVAVLGDRRLEPAVRELANPDRFEQWVGATALPSAADREAREGAEIELRIGQSLAPHIDQSALDRLMREIATSVSVPIPPIAVSHAEISDYRRTEEARTPPPAGYELQLMVRGRLIALGRFFPDRVQTLTRDWDGAKAAGATPCFNEALWEPVRWVDAKTLDDNGWHYRRWSFEEAVSGWLDALLRRFIALLFSRDEVYTYLGRVAERAGGPRIVADLPSLSNLLHPIWIVLARLVRERVPLAERDIEIIARLLEIVRESDNFDAALVTILLREHVSDDLCRSFADRSNQLLVMLLDQADERWLGGKLNKTSTRLSFDLTPQEELGIIGAVRAHFEQVARADHAWPVLVCEDNLRAPLFDMLQHYDARLFVLSYTELSPDVRLTARGVVRKFSPAGAAT